MPIRHVDGDILTAPEQYIVHQCNCVTNHGRGLSEVLFRAFPYADVYAGRREHSTPGTIAVRGGTEEERGIINLFGQVYPGRPRFPSSSQDGYQARERYFHQGLKAIGAISGVESLAFPYQIGCGLAGGNWDRYLAMLERFAAEHPHIQVTLYRKR